VVFVSKKIILKRPHEIEIMREAGVINAAALAAVRQAIRPGITTAELDRIAADVIAKNEAIAVFKGYPGAYPFPATTTISVNEELVHGIPGDRVLKEGDIVSVDCGTKYKGYVADSAFSMGVGEVSTDAQQLLDVTERALSIGIDMLRPGKRIGDISAAIQDWVEGNNLFVTREYSGHGVGKDMHEGPSVPNYGTPGRGLVLRPGVTIALEPMVLIGTDETKVMSDQWTVSSKDDSLTAHFEHTIAVTESDPVILTR
jgi:methionyl aminopeptidase